MTEPRTTPFGPKDKRVYVAPDEFCQLLTSRKNLVRRDEPGEGLHGLWDTEGGVLYLVETNEFSRIAGRSRLGHA